MLTYAAKLWVLRHNKDAERPLRAALVRLATPQEIQSRVIFTDLLDRSVEVLGLLLSLLALLVQKYKN
jgi:hypothetical protein